MLGLHIEEVRRHMSSDMGLISRIKNAWSAFNYQEGYPTPTGYDASSSLPLWKSYRISRGSIVNMVLSKIAIDVSMVEFKHVKMDGDPKTEEEMKSGLNDCLQVEANIDQSNIEFMQDLVFSLLDEGAVAVVPVETDLNPNQTGGYDIYSMRVGKIVDWYAQSVRIEAYNEATGQYEQILMNKRNVAIIENPLYSVLNAPNSTLQRLQRKMQLLDRLDERLVGKKLDLLVQVPYKIKGDMKRKLADDRLKDITNQLSQNELGIAYIDGTEKVIQLNRPVENSLLQEIESLQNEFFNQLGFTKAVFDGTASEQELRSYYQRGVAPFCERIKKEFERKFLTKKARTQGQMIVYHMDPFKMVPVSTLGSLADTFRRNAVLTSNEIRESIGFQRSDDPRADELFNPNIADSNQNINGATTPMQAPEDMSTETVEGGYDENTNTNEYNT